ncbi:succinate dehydrogenase, cytochrome b556 subunit [Solemya velesiana gill symbiont]|uniref:Succinate dehydrogenase cytochrome b556 subunit n=1 Tax=Solemya velesiana gill symbiont TaxID=1918948 RepID=A0A1T2KX72_9GAMM|nr:succinate dehydrogenase, cytochrome b556 subunit [Solemya velesiana gill symbiont]OOZ37360.1 succinate dehydrogenase, cytochrome b556 subunit [Solemya velesiana gill symbiont]
MSADNRPVFLDLTKYRFPMAAIMSVGHRASGIFMVMLVPFLAYLLDLSLSSSDGFAEVQAILDHWILKPIGFVALWALIHHLLSGIRFLLIDFHIGVERDTGRKSATVVTYAAPVVTLLIGVML